MPARQRFDSAIRNRKLNLPIINLCDQLHRNQPVTNTLRQAAEEDMRGYAAIAVQYNRSYLTHFQSFFRKDGQASPDLKVKRAAVIRAHETADHQFLQQF